ncbi:MAG: protein kinase [Granulosicoccaceae bacterium]
MNRPSDAQLPIRIGRYKTGQILGVGGFGIVVSALDEDLGSSVAIKILSPDWASDPLTRQRFSDEAKLLRNIRSDHLINIHDIGELEDGRPFFVMDLADRGTFADRLNDGSVGTRGDVDTACLVAVVTALADSLAALHVAGFVHRDVTPGNLLIESRASAFTEEDRNAVTMVRSGLVSVDERLLLGDLGLAKDVLDSAATIVGGTPRYSSPEQFDPDGEIGPSTDVFGATAVLWRVLSGKAPPENIELEGAISSVAERWRKFMLRGMSTSSDQRFSSMAAWKAEAMKILGVGTSEVSADVGDRYEVESCPYQGLVAFQTRDADRFYGRDELVLRLVERLRSKHILVVGGSSGSGKSSLVRAGLIPALRNGALPDSARWPHIVFTPGSDPLKELEYQLRRTLENLPGDIGGMDFSRQDDHRWRRMAERISDVTGGLLICIDQFEEIFTFDHEQKVLDSIFAALSSIADPSESLSRLVFIIRADFYGSSSRFPWLADVITKNQVLVGPMSRIELHKAIAEPARHSNLRLDEALVEAVLEEVGTTSSTLPLVSHAMAESWKLRSGNRLTLDNYRASGGVAGAIAQTAETLFRDSFNAEEQHAARRLLLRLISPGQGVPDTRRPYAVADLKAGDDQSVMSPVMNAMVDARLLTVDREIVQLAHEAIILSWPRLSTWISESRDDLHFMQRIERVAAEWQEADRDPDLLYHGAPLQTAMSWYAEHKESVSGLEAAFLDAAADAERVANERQLLSERRTRRNWRLAFSSLSVLLVASLISSVIAFNAFREARKNETDANFRLAQSLASQAADLADRNPRLALALAAEVIERQANASVDARIALVNAAAALEASPYTAFAELAVGDAITVAIHPQRELIAIGNRDGSVSFWDPAGISLGSPVKAHGGAIEEMAFSSDGLQLISVSLDGTIMNWDLRDALALPAPRLLAEFSTLIWSIAISPDGKSVATAAEDGAVRLFDVDDFSKTKLLTDDARDVLTVNFSPDGSVLLAGNGRGEIYSWNMSDTETINDFFMAHESDVWEIVFYPDSSRFVTASSDGRVRIWDVRSNAFIVEPFADVAANIRGIQVTADGLLIAGDENGGLLFWDIATEQLLGASVARHDAQITDVAAQLSGSLLASIGGDQVLRTWLKSEEKSFLSLSVHGSGAYGLAMSDSRNLIATGDGAGRVRISDGLDGQVIGVPLTLSEERVWAVAFDGTGKLIAAADQNGTLAVWDVDSGRRLARIPNAHIGSISTLVFHPSMNLLFSAGSDGQIKQWDQQTLEAAGDDMGDHVGGVTRFVLSPDSTSIASADLVGKIRIWNIETASIDHEWQGDDNAIWSIAWSQDGSEIATAHADEIVQLWNADSGQALRDLTPHPGGATDVTYLSDGITIVSASRDGTLRLWDRELGVRIGQAFENPAQPIWRLAGSHANNSFISSNANGQVKVWNTLNKSLFCRQASWDTAAQRRYLGAGEKPMACQ